MASSLAPIVSVGPSMLSTAQEPWQGTIHWVLCVVPRVDTFRMQYQGDEGGRFRAVAG